MLHRIGKPQMLDHFLRKYGLSVIIGLGSITLINGFFRGQSRFGKYLELNETHSILKDRVKKLDKENELLQDEIVKLKSSTEYAKKVLRDRYHITEPDERIMFFSNLEKKDQR